MRGTKNATVFLAAYALLSLPACPPKVVPERERPRPVYLSATPEELLSALAARNRAITSITARGRIEYRFTYATRDYRGADIRMQFEKPGNVYIRGSARLAGTLFRLVSDGERFWAEAPHDEKVYTGPVRSAPKLEGKENIWEGLNPAVLAESLLLDDIADYRVVCATFPNRYIIDLLEESSEGGLSLRRRIEFEREGLSVTRHQVFGSAGEVVTDVYLHRYEDTAGVELPRLYSIRRYWEELSLRMELEEISINPELNRELFRYDVPAGFEIEDLEEKKEDAEPR
jgi:outer membrane lipoprotein-sorting protein